MLDWLRRLRREVSPTARELAEDVFEVREPETSLILAGQRDLGSFFYKEKLGFTEDTWPYVLIGEFYWDFNSEGQREFSWLSWRRRIVINYERPWVAVQVRLFRHGRPGHAYAYVPTKLQASECWSIESAPCLCLQFGEGYVKHLDINIDTSESILKILSARLNFLWENGRAERRSSVPEFGQLANCVWRNPGKALIDDLNGLDREVMGRRGRESY